MSDTNITEMRSTSVQTELSQISFVAALQEKIAEIRHTLRPGQQQMADWQSGPLAVSAVPGAGKSTGMAAAAAIAIARQYQQAAESAKSARRQLVVVTFTRSAAANIKVKIRNYLQQLSLPQTGFAVYTLHGLALNIASRHPDLSGLELENVTLITPNQSHRFIRELHNAAAALIRDRAKVIDRRLAEGVALRGIANIVSNSTGSVRGRTRTSA